ncbi:IS30 family transposase [Clostridiales Family XIII bacterium PM5-7]
MGKHYKHLTWNDRLTIDKMYRKKFAVKDIADVVGCSVATIYNELKRATYVRTMDDLTEREEYNPEGAERRYRENLKKKGRERKLSNAPRLREYIETQIVENKYSPAAVLMKINNDPALNFEVQVESVNTLYKSIKLGDFERLKMSHLPQREKLKRKGKLRRAKRAARGTSIEKRPKEVLSREEFGHWEMDTVVGKMGCKKCILVLTERKTRVEIMEEMMSHTVEETIKALNRIEKRYGGAFYKIFKSITVDNGSEFNNESGIKKAFNRVGNRTEVFYCHPYSSFERGSNENQNRLIRRFLPKGADFDKVLNRNIVKNVESWINDYPRRIFRGQTAKMMYEKEVQILLSG